MKNTLLTSCALRVLHVKNLRLEEEITKPVIVFIKEKHIQ